MAIEIGSPEALAVIMADKRLARLEADKANQAGKQEAIKESGLRVWRVRTPATVVQTVAAKDRNEAIEVALYSGEWEYDDGSASIAASAIESPGHGLDGWLVADHERFMKHRGAVSKAP